MLFFLTDVFSEASMTIRLARLRRARAIQGPYETRLAPPPNVQWENCHVFTLNHLAFRHYKRVLLELIPAECSPPPLQH
jgi:hypothetical protein